MARALAVVLLALPMFADLQQPLAVVQMRDGSRIELKAEAPRGYIVEFREAPLAARGARTTSAASYRDTFARFRRDLGEVRRGGPAVSAAPRIEHEYHRVFHGVSVALDPAELERVRALPYVKAVHVDETVEAFADTTAIQRIGADRVWSERKTRGAGIVVAVIDTGVDATHPALAGKVIGGYDFVDEDDDPADEQGHGTHVAGIVAGEGGGVQGVAPDAKLVAYRVLDERGQGSASDIIAALEWATDPDRDNDFSDHLDVANLSLGSRMGDADSPTSLAADRAMQAGVVVCLAAGNTPGGQSIGSPAASRLAITVGASDAQDQVAFWSSRGPAFPDLALKPEIAAPGDDIVSARMGGGTVALSGTSMAAPHVAGAAALLLALHPEWSPAEVKSALVASADAVNEEVMARGGGRLNVYDAAAAAMAIEPAALSFGNGQPGGWTRSRTVRVTNRAAEARAFTATATAAGGVTLAVEPPAFTLDAGASREVVLTVTVAPGASAPTTTLSLGGVVSFAAGGGAARLPFVAIDAAQVRLDYDAPLSQVLPWWNCENGSAVSPRYEGEGRFASLLPYRRCGLFVLSLVQRGPRMGETSLLFETHQLAADVHLTRSPADSIHAIELAGVDATGARLEPQGTFHETPYRAAYAFDYPEGSLYTVESIGVGAYLPLRTSTIDDATIVASEMLFDFPRHRIVGVNHEPVRGGIHGNVTLRSLPSDLQHARVQVAPQSGEWLLVSSIATFVGGKPAWISTGGGDVAVRNGWSGDVYVTPARDPNAWAAPALGTAWLRLPDPRTDILTAPIRSVDGRVVMSYEKVPSPAAYAVAPGETLRIGDAPLHARSHIDTLGTAFAVFPGFFGPANEFVESARTGFAYELRDAAGAVLAQGTAQRPYFSADPHRHGTFHAKVVSPRGTELALTFDTGRDDRTPPTLSSLRIAGASGATAAAFAPGARATLAFTVEDASLRAVRAWWRAEEAEWQPLATAAEHGVHRAELPTHVPGRVGLRIEMEDASGNVATMTAGDAYSVGARRRALRP